jgi:hypothetical protein
MLFIFLFVVSAINYNVNFTSTFIQGTKYISWNNTVVNTVKNDMFNKNIICNVNYVSGSQFPLSSFGFLPINMTSYMMIRPQDWCISIFLDKYKYEEMCKQFDNEISTQLNNYYLSFPEILLNGPQLVNYITLYYGQICMSVVSLNFKLSDSNNKWFWQLLLDYAKFNCYDTTSFTVMFLDEPWRNLLNITTHQVEERELVQMISDQDQVLINGDYHTDNFGNITFTNGYVSYYTYYVARCNKIICT